MDDIVGNNPATAEYLGTDSLDGKVGTCWFFCYGARQDLLVPVKDPANGGLNSDSWEGFTIEGLDRAGRFPERLAETSGHSGAVRPRHEVPD